MKKLRVFPIVLLLVMSLCVLACPTNQMLTPVSEMTPVQKASWFMSVYNKQYALYKVEAEKPDLNDTQKEYLRDKHAMLTKVYPMIKLYNSYVDTGSVVSPENEAEIISLVNQLLMRSLE